MEHYLKITFSERHSCSHEGLATARNADNRHRGFQSRYVPLLLFIVSLQSQGLEQNLFSQESGLEEKIVLSKPASDSAME